MQVFINPSELQSFDNLVQVFASLDDNASFDPAWAEGLVRLSLPMTALESVDGSMTLQSGWRETNKRSILQGESTARINDVFNEHSQSNANAEMNEYIREHGADQDRWPQDARLRAEEIDRCWDYVNEVRRRYRQLMNMAVPANPAVDAHWPNRIRPFEPRYA